MAEFSADSCNRIRLEFDEQYNNVVRKITKNETLLKDLKLKQQILSTLAANFPEYMEELDKIDNEIIIANNYANTLEDEKAYSLRKLQELDKIQNRTTHY